MDLLGSLSPKRFLEEHWQKKPLLVRQAIPGFQGLLSPAELARLASRDDVIARTVQEAAAQKNKGRRGPRWRLQEGPFPRLDLSRAPKENYTLLVGGLEAHVDGAWDLLSRFSFIPWARIDDLMVSYAAPGGSVGPHFDLYDVFLLQGPGRRRWQISVTDDLECSDEEEVRVLRRFTPTDEWVLEPGDMLYLPPRVAHWGVAVTECTTYSIGFAAPTHEQLVHNFLGFLGQEASPDEGAYEDPDLQPQAHAAEIPGAMVERVRAVLDELRFDDERIGVFLGRLLTGPKPHTPVRRPKRVMAEAAFVDELSRAGVLHLGKATRMLFRGETFFVDGEAFSAPADKGAALLRRLANERRLPLPAAVSDDVAAVLYNLYRAGCVTLER